MANMVKDPVCGMTIDADQTQWKSEYQGRTYYFCSQSCKRQFDEDPQRYAGQA